MSKKISLLLICLSCVLSAFSQKILSPDEFLGYQLGDQFTYHSRIVEYFKYIAKASKNVKLVQYGTTNEGRPLLTAFIASDENIGRLEEIRHNNLRLAGIEKTGTAIAWTHSGAHPNRATQSANNCVGHP